MWLVLHELLPLLETQIKKKDNKEPSLPPPPSPSSALVRLAGRQATTMNGIPTRPFQNKQHCRFSCCMNHIYKNVYAKKTTKKVEKMLKKVCTHGSYIQNSAFDSLFTNKTSF